MHPFLPLVPELIFHSPLLFSEHSQKINHSCLPGFSLNSKFTQPVTKFLFCFVFVLVLVLFLVWFCFNLRHSVLIPVSKLYRLLWQAPVPVLLGEGVALVRVLSLAGPLVRKWSSDCIDWRFMAT